jgi:hypothetical protein
MMAFGRKRYVERCRKTEEKEDREVHTVLRKVE